MTVYPTTESELLAYLQHADPQMREIGWGFFFDQYYDELALDARRSLLKRGMTDNLEEDTMIVVREMWLKVQDTIGAFEYRKEGGLYHYARTYLAYECWNLRRVHQREQRQASQQVSFEAVDDSGGEKALNALLALIDHYHQVSDSFDPPDESAFDLRHIAQTLVQQLDPDDIALLQDRLVAGTAYETLAKRLDIKANNVRQRVFRARQRFIAAYTALVHEAYRTGVIAYGTFKRLMRCIEEAA